MKKIIILICIIIAVVILFPKENEEFRIRVIANSDSSADQNQKMEVVNALIKKINNYNDDNIVNEIKSNLEELNREVKKVLGSSEYSIEIKKLRFPPKQLNGEVIKGGKYKALVVIIGEGKGKNWWSLISPEFSKGFEDIETKEVEFKFYFYEELKKSFK